MALRLFAVLGPFCVIADRIDAQTDDLGVAPIELRFEPGHVAEFGCADRRKVLRMAKQDRPAATDPVVKADRPCVVSAVKSGASEREEPS